MQMKAFMNLVEVDEMTQAEIVAAMVSGTAEAQSEAMVKMISQRVPIMTLARAEAMAKRAKKSRNAMINLLLETGLDNVESLLANTTKKSINASVAKAVKAMVKDAETITE
jgi:predicted DNA-binding protein